MVRALCCLVCIWYSIMSALDFNGMHLVHLWAGSTFLRLITLCCLTPCGSAFSVCCASVSYHLLPVILDFGLLRSCVCSMIALAHHLSGVEP